MYIDNMHDITTTNLRTQSSKLVETLKKGGVVSLIHRSKVIGVIKPKKEPKALQKEDINELKKLAEDLSLPKKSYKDRANLYKTHLSDKYGKNIS